MGLFSSSTSSSVCTESPLVGSNVDIVGDFTIQQLMEIIGVICFGVVTLATFFAVTWHCIHLGNRREQKTIIRILLTPFFFALFGMISIVSYHVSPYLLDAGKVWESLAVVALFELFVLYMSEDETDHSHQKLFDTLRPAGYSESQVRITCIRIYQFPVITIAKYIALDVFTALQCRTSKAHQNTELALNVIQAVSTVIALFSIIAFYRRNRAALKARKAVAKMTSLKIIVAVVVLQQLVFTGLEQHSSVLNGSTKVSNADYEQGVFNFLTVAEMILFIWGMIYAYPATPYMTKNLPAPVAARKNSKLVMILKTLFDVINITDVLKGIALCVGIGSHSAAGATVSGGQYSNYDSPSGKEYRYGSGDSEAPMAYHAQRPAYGPEYGSQAQRIQRPEQAFQPPAGAPPPQAVTQRPMY